MKVFPIPALLFLLLCIPSLHAENLSDIYNEALENDPQYRAAEFSQLAGQEIVVQGRAGLLPNITISGQTNWNEYYQFNELQSAYNNNSVNARFTQPLFRLDSWFTFKRSQKLTDASEADFAYAQQALIVRTVEKYFGVLRAEDNLTAARSKSVLSKNNSTKFNSVLMLDYQLLLKSKRLNLHLISVLLVASEQKECYLMRKKS